MSDAATREKIRAFIEEIVRARGKTSVSDDESLLEAGLIDSLEIFRLVAFLEESFGVRIRDEELSHDNFETIVQIERFVSEKLQKR